MKISSAQRVFVTGASGFIGSNLIRSLLADGHDVHILQRSRSANWRLEPLVNQITIHQADLLDVLALRRVVKDCSPDMVYHLAAGGVTATPMDRTHLLQTNIIGTANLLDALDAVPYRCFLHAGSGIEYGPRDGAIPEEASVNPLTDYALAKAAASLLCQVEARKGKPIVQVRIFAAYGPWEAAKRLVPYVMKSCWRCENPRVSAGIQERDFIHVYDVVSLMKAATNKEFLHGKVLHAGTGVSHSVAEMVETIIDVAGGNHAIFGAQPMHAGEPLQYLASISETTQLTGWKPKYNLRQGVEQTWKWFCTTLPMQEAA